MQSAVVSFRKSAATCTRFPLSDDNRDGAYRDEEQAETRELEYRNASRKIDIYNIVISQTG